MNSLVGFLKCTDAEFVTKHANIQILYIEQQKTFLKSVPQKRKFKKIKMNYMFVAGASIGRR